MYAIFDDQSFTDTLTKDIVSFEQLGPEQVWSKYEQMTLPITVKMSQSIHKFG